ncbi:Surfeit locus protein 1 [Entophlyctis luteolus]|nr:Surfeit locus protein 1 [Entophlyctis luteolus]
MEEEFTKVTFSGHFVSDTEMHVGLRSRGVSMACFISLFSVVKPGGAGEEQSGGLFGSPNASGYFVYSPFDVDEADGMGKLRVLVNRGWIPRDSNTAENQAKRAVGEEFLLLSDESIIQIRDRVTIEAVSRRGENPKSFPKNDPAGNQWYSIDVEEMSKLTGSSPLLFDVISNSETNSQLLSRDGAPLARNGKRLMLKNDHFAYMVTWFGLSAFSAWALSRRSARLLVRR